MKTLSNRFLLPVSIGVTSAAILSILVYVFTNIFFGSILNTTGYYVLVIVLGITSASLGMLQILPKFTASHFVSNQLQAYAAPLEYDSDTIHSTRNQQQGSPVKVTMEINGTPVTIESPDVGKIEDIMQHLTQSIQASNVAEAKAAQLRVREGKGTYKTENNPE
ncbi:MAG: hypothetical protein ACRDIV_00010 [Ktedonobacteraceae bacterium]